MKTVVVLPRPPSCSVVYNAVDSGPAAVECTRWRWEWLAKNEQFFNVGLVAELSCLINPPSLLVVQSFAFCFDNSLSLSTPSCTAPRLSERTPASTNSP